MKVQHVSLMATQEATAAGNISLTPELLAATGARYSRSNEGLDAIAARIDWSQTSKSVDTIFRMVDYGHASIADMAPVAMFIDGVSLYLAAYLWANSPTASGQESSTRYIEYKSSTVATAKELGIEQKQKLTAHIAKSFDLYTKALAIWTRLAQSNPEAMGIPKSVLEDSSEKGVKKKMRMIRNFAFDRARVFLPVCAKTNVMMVMSARSWVELISLLLSHPLKEKRSLGKKLRDQLELVTPRLVRHAVSKPDTEALLAQDMKDRKGMKSVTSKDDGAFIDLYEHSDKTLVRACHTRVNRYSLFGTAARMSPIRFGWRKIAFAEIRDLNRHRTGSKFCDFFPSDFHDASDQMPDMRMRKELKKLTLYAQKLVKTAQLMVRNSDPTYIYWLLLGHTFRFEHLTTLDKFIYEAELRTGVGAHYKYAQHVRNCLHLLYKNYPGLKKVLFEGSAEPE